MRRLICLCFLLVFFILCPRILFAATTFKVGTHLAQGDPNAQIKVIDFIKSQNPPSGYPITAMIDIGATTEQIQKLAGALSTGGFLINIRVLGIRENTTPDQAKALAEQLKGVTWNTAGGKKP